MQDRSISLLPIVIQLSHCLGNRPKPDGVFSCYLHIVQKRIGLFQELRHFTLFARPDPPDAYAQIGSSDVFNEAEELLRRRFGG
jgi:hypothetical protein